MHQTQQRQPEEINYTKEKEVREKDKENKIAKIQVKTGYKTRKRSNKQNLTAPKKHRHTRKKQLNK